MNVSCEIIRDLLPLYAENMESKASQQLVQEHLAHCASCTAELQSMKTQLAAPQCELKPLEHIRRDIRKKRTWTVIFAVSVAAILLLSVFSYLASPEYFSGASDVYDVVEYGEQEVLLAFDSRVTGYRATRYRDPDGHVCVGIMAWTTRLDRLAHAASPVCHVPEDADLVYFCAPDEEDRLVWSRVTTDYAGVQSLPTLAIGYWFLICAALALLLGVSAAVLHRHRKLADVLAKLCGVPLSYLGACVCIQGLSTMSFEPLQDVLWIAVTMIFWYAALLSGAQLFRIFRKSRR